MNRPHRHLCPEADMRDAMTDDEFWMHVFGADPDDDPFEGPDPDIPTATPCVTCGSAGACAWDSEGRALIHTLSEGEA